MRVGFFVGGGDGERDDSGELVLRLRFLGTGDCLRIGALPLRRGGVSERVGERPLFLGGDRESDTDRRPSLESLRVGEREREEESSRRFRGPGDEDRRLPRGGERESLSDLALAPRRGGERDSDLARLLCGVLDRDRESDLEE